MATVVAIALLVPAAPGAGADNGIVPVPQDPFLCTTEFHGLGQPLVDNQDGLGTPVYAEGEGELQGWSQDCQAPDRVTYHYRTTGGGLVELSPDVEELPGNVAMLPVSQLIGAGDMELDGAEAIPHVLRFQRGTLPGQRYMYSIAMLVPWEEVIGETDGFSHDHWNGRLLFSFDGGVGIGHSQGSLSTSSATLREAMELGHAVLYSSGTATSVHYNLIRGGATAVEAKARFVADHGDPRYTVGIGGSGGGIQQYIYGQNNPGVLDAALPLYSYPDMTTQTIHTGDCELLEYYMDVTDGDNPRWADWNQRRVVQGMNSIEGFTSSWQNRTGATGSSECIEGWRGLTPLAMNPNFGFATGMDEVLLPRIGELLPLALAGLPPIPEDFPDIGRYLRVAADPATWVEWTHWSDVREVYGTDPATGLARVPWDNVGVQYGLRSVADGTLTPEEFLDLNAKVGSWGAPEDAVPESCGLINVMLGAELAFFASLIGLCEGSELDQHSARQMRFSPDGETPAPRRTGDVEAARAAYQHGLVFDGTFTPDIPVIDARHYLEHKLDMHNVHQSWAARERIVRAHGHHDSHLIWFLDARPDTDDVATTALLQNGFRVVDQWLANLAANPAGGVAAAKPAEAVDTCWDTDGSLIAAGDDVWSGAVELIESGQGGWTDEPPQEVGGVPVGACAQHFPLHSTSRIVAGAPVTGDLYICHRMPVRTAVQEGLYGGWQPAEADITRIEATHPTGVCDHDLPDSARPGVSVLPAPSAESSDGGLLVTDAVSGAQVDVRRNGEIVTTATAQGAAAGASATAAANGLWLGPLEDGDYVVSQTVAGQRSLLSAPITVTQPAVDPEVPQQPDPDPDPTPDPDPDPDPEPTTPPPDDPTERAAADGRLPRTGTELTPLLVAAAALLGAGAAARRAARRRAASQP